MPTHTREPWQARSGFKGYTALVYADQGNDRRDIATVETPDAEGEANRLLIVHAARLLEAAEALLTRIEGMTTDDFSRGGERVEREALRAIIDQITA